MTVLLKGYDVPKSCSECYIEDCSLCFDRRGVAENGGIHGDCPILQMPPHGRLIDADEFEKLLNREGGVKLENVPTVVEAEK